MTSRWKASRPRWTETLDFWIIRSIPPRGSRPASTKSGSRASTRRRPSAAWLTDRFQIQTFNGRNMKKRIEELTVQQLEVLPKMRENWIKQGLSTERVERAPVVAALEKI